MMSTVLTPRDGGSLPGDGALALVTAARPPDGAAAGPANEGPGKAVARPQQQPTQRRSYVVPMALPHGAPPLLVRPPSSSLLRSRGEKEEAGGSDRSRPIHQRDNEAAPTAATARTTARYTLYGAVPLGHTAQSGGPIDTSCLAGGGLDEAWPPTKNILGCPHCGVRMTSRCSNYWSCDVCDTRSSVVERTSMCCRDCDFDYCRSCYNDADF
jgi:hypothetical protein